MNEKKVDVTERHGQCLCGAISVTAKKAGNSVGACHCTMCRRWGGGPFMEINCGTEVTFGGNGKVSLFSSSEWAERGFCSQCGTHLFYRLKGTGHHMIPAGVFKNDNNLVFNQQVFIDEKPSYYRFANETQDMTGAELFAKFAPPD